MQNNLKKQSHKFLSGMAHLKARPNMAQVIFAFLYLRSLGEPGFDIAPLKLLELTCTDIKTKIEVSDDSAQAKAEDDMQKARKLLERK